MTSPTSAVGYCRISQDTRHDEKGVARQEQDIRKRAKELGWKLDRIFVDNDISATKGKKREDFDELRDCLESDTHDGLILYDLDRFTRTPRELEDFIDLANRKNVALSNIMGDIDLSTANGRMLARFKGAIARQEAERIGERVARKHQQRAEEGKPHKSRWRSFGYTTEFEVIESEALIVKEAFKRFAAGESIYAIAQDFNERKIPTVNEARWIRANLRNILDRALYAGISEYRGNAVGKSVVKPIIDQSLLIASRARLADVSRTSHEGKNARKYLLSGICTCGKCGTPMYAMRDKYICKAENGGCGRVVRKMLPVDELVERTLIRTLEEAELTTEKPVEDHTAAELAQHEEKLKKLREAYDAGDVELEDFIPMSKAIREKIKAVQTRRAEFVKTIDTSNIGERYKRMNLSQKRALISKAIKAVVIMPNPPEDKGKRTFNINLIQIVWS